MKENEWLTNLVDELQSLPEPDYEKEFDINKQTKIHDNLMKFTRSTESKKRRGYTTKSIVAGFTGIAALLLFCVIFLPLWEDSNRATLPEIETFEKFFHKKMEKMHKDEKNYSYMLIHTELNVDHGDDAIAIFKENNSEGEQIFIAYFEKQDNQWEWKYTRGAQWNSRKNWSSMHTEPYIYSGTLDDNSIKEVFVGVVQAKMISVQGDKRFWYAISPVKETEVMIVDEEGNKKVMEEVETEVKQN